MVNSADSQHWVPGEPATCTLKAEAYSWQTRQHLTSIRTAVHLPEGWSGITHLHGRPYIGANGVSWPPWKNGWKIKKRKHAKNSAFLCLYYILRAIGAGRHRKRRYADHIFIQIYFRMHHFSVKFSKFSSPQATTGHWPPKSKSCGRSCPPKRHSWTSPNEGHWELLWGSLWTPPQTTY